MRTEPRPQALALGLSTLLVASLALAHPQTPDQDPTPPPGQGKAVGKGQGFGKGQGRRQGFTKGQGKGQASDPRFVEDRDTFHFLLDHGNRITRTIKDLPNGVETVTETDDPDIRSHLRRHVAAMHDRILENRPIHRRDPLFDAIFQHANQIDWTSEPTDKGIRVRETSDDPYVAKLIQAHARVVSAFIANGRSEMMKNHPVPPRDGQYREAFQLDPIDELSPARRAQFDKAVAARDEAFKTFLERLKTILAREGTAAAIRVCKEEAPAITNEIATKQKLRLGRTSLRLRNPANTPPDWARALVRTKPTEPSAFVGDQGTLAVLLPIKLRAECVACHGKADDIEPSVRMALTQLYPNDQATGFAEGDLRGWFWIEVPGTDPQP